jgi:hypothetical protein
VTGFALLLPLALGACSSVEGISSDVGALGVGTAVGAATGNPIVGLAAGLGTRIAIDESVELGERRYYGAIQQAIAEAGSTAPIGEARAWRYDGLIGDLGSVAGVVEPVRAFGSEMRCREVIFSVERYAEPPNDAVAQLRADLGLMDELDEPRFFVGTICRSDDTWSWAVAAPSTDRWGVLQ